MVIPEKEKGVKSFRVPKVLFNSFIFIVLIVLTIVGILSYDYVKILRQVYENRHLSIENRQLKEQIQLFNMKLNTLTDDIERVGQFEKKLRIITGFNNDIDKTIPIKLNPHTDEDHSLEVETRQEKPPTRSQEKATDQFLDTQLEKPNNERKPDSILPEDLIDNQLKEVKKSIDEVVSIEKFQDIKDLYERKIATNFGLLTGYAYTKEWNDLIKQSFKLASSFAFFDYRFAILRNMSKELETRINQLDQFLLDKDSFLRSTPTLIPAWGWITSYYGPRESHYSGRVKMHEGLDVGVPIGTDIIAPADGIVKVSTKNPGFGNYIEIDHGYGLETIFAHNSANLVRKGQKIKRGDVIGKSGNTGLSTGPHVHYEVRINGTPVDPLYYILD